MFMYLAAEHRRRRDDDEDNRAEKKSIDRAPCQTTNVL